MTRQEMEYTMKVGADIQALEEFLDSLQTFLRMRPDKFILRCDRVFREDAEGYLDTKMKHLVVPVDLMIRIKNEITKYKSELEQEIEKI